MVDLDTRPARLRHGRRGAQLHKGGGAPRARSAGALGSGPAARVPARRAAVRAHDPPGAAHGGRRPAAAARARGHPALDAGTQELAAAQRVAGAVLRVGVRPARVAVAWRTAHETDLAREFVRIALEAGSGDALD